MIGEPTPAHNSLNVECPCSLLFVLYYYSARERGSAECHENEGIFIVNSFHSGGFIETKVKVQLNSPMGWVEEISEGKCSFAFHVNRSMPIHTVCWLETWELRGHRFLLNFFFLGGGFKIQFLPLFCSFLFLIWSSNFFFKFYCGCYIFKLTNIVILTASHFFLKKCNFKLVVIYLLLRHFW